MVEANEGVKVHVLHYYQCSSWELLSRGAQSNNLKAALQV